MRRCILKLPLILVISTVSFGQHAVVSKELTGQDPQSKLDVIIQYAEPASPAVHQKIIDGGGSLKAELHAVKGGAYTIYGRQLSSLESDPNVVYVSPDRKIHTLLDNSAAGAFTAAALLSKIGRAHV